MTLGDEELMAMFSAGMTEAFDMLFERYRHRIYRFALHCLYDPADAEDIVQEVFVRVARSAARYQPQGRFKSWIFQIAANRIRSQAHLRSRDQAGIRDAGDHACALNQVSDTENEMITGDLINRALAAINPQQRMVVLLREVEGLSFDAVATALDLSPENVRVQLHRARRHLLAILYPNSSGKGMEVST
jgi:RNA polymerase sigma-70 factor, ECF subfamily